MDPNTGELRELLAGDTLKPDEVQVPKELELAAQVELAGRLSTFVDPGRGSPMSQFLRDLRRSQKNGKAKRRRIRKQAKRQKGG